MHFLAQAFLDHYTFSEFKVIPTLLTFIMMVTVSVAVTALFAAIGAAAPTPNSGGGGPNGP